ncbi:MAG: right-handed parallel beta-helix repeat-containing protein [Bacteroidaceae bacterium]|nr:right-handed parallel beta-helix repeat-containing protein [Bacteroidaceae bacterium]
MRKFLLTLLALLAVMAVKAQVINEYDVFWDGRIRFVATEVDETTGAAHLEGYDIDNNYYQFNLKAGNGKGQYVLNAQGYIPFLRAEGGWKVDYISEQGITFMAFKNPQDRIVSVITLMDEDNVMSIVDVYLNGITADEYPVSEMLNTYLMDGQYLARFSPEELREMKAQLQDMPDLSFKGKINMQLIETELEINPNQRLKPLMSREEFMARIESGEFGEGDYVGDGDYIEEDDGIAQKDADFDEYVEVEVSNEREFILALGSNRLVRIADGVTLNLSSILNDQDFFWDNRHTNWMDGDMEEYHDGAVWIFSEEVYDGRQLTLYNVHNLTIEGGNGSQIVVQPRYACVFNLYRSTEIKFRNLTMGHTDEGYCMGAVIGSKYFHGMYVENCDLYGCGTYGIYAENTSLIEMTNSVIRDCSEGIMWLNDDYNCSFTNCDFYDNKSGVSAYDTPELKFNNCRFFRNLGELFNVHRKVMLDACEMWQPDDSRGTENVLSYEEVDYIWNNDRGENEQRREGVGPQNK